MKPLTKNFQYILGACPVMQPVSILSDHRHIPVLLPKLSLQFSESLVSSIRGLLWMENDTVIFNNKHSKPDDVTHNIANTTKI